MAYKFSLKAKKDLIAIADYTADQFGEAQSDKYLEQLKNTLEKISDFPRMGRARTDIAENVLSFVSQFHTIFYQIQRDYILIIRILHNQMDHRRYM